MNSEVFPSNYTVFRKDKPSGHGGGVFLACKQEIDCKQIDFDSDFELVACETKLPNCSPLIIIAFYQPPYNDNEYMENLCDSFGCIIIRYNNLIIWLAGNLNLPNIDWSNNIVNGNESLLTDPL